VFKYRAMGWSVPLFKAIIHPSTAAQTDIKKLPEKGSSIEQGLAWAKRTSLPTSLLRQTMSHFWQEKHEMATFGSYCWPGLPLPRSSNTSRRGEREM
jgi:FKBP-type peptidyl-prolyl cis-trans isomerase (trigger factor)